MLSISRARGAVTQVNCVLFIFTILSVPFPAGYRYHQKSPPIVYLYLHDVVTSRLHREAVPSTNLISLGVGVPLYELLRWCLVNCLRLTHTNK